MTMQRKALLLVAAALVLAATPAMARRNDVSCICTPAPLAVRAQQADRIFVARADKIDIPEKMVEPGRADPPAIVSMTVSEVLKGMPADSKTAELQTSLTRVTCAGHPFEAGRSYLVFAYQRKASTYETWSLYDFKTGTYDVGGLCGGTADMMAPETQAELEQLRAMKKAGELPDNAKPELE